ncbi:VOC family protein [Notoacmeibacter sp. MSK16QG-6]|uniref:VOC family protein n=1 Tax=Notoacmeibacter sp. MSK16QG-6 TaxID=2957982 RepID=UPI00209DD98C|nr:VOC family protein [Notoacmeibacter sp. MSK16QG-6]MCP1199184.1 VOC family protein [Notoacmeibacter sp. MSK16QG-6]
MAFSIALVTLIVPDYDEALAFYCGMLGFNLLEDTDLGGGKRWLRVSPDGGGTALLLAKAATDGQAKSIGCQVGGRVAFFLQTDAFDRDWRAMSDAGVHFVETPREERYGKVAVFEDPFGNRWDLIQPMRALADR